MLRKPQYTNHFTTVWGFFVSFKGLWSACEVSIITTLCSIYTYQGSWRTMRSFSDSFLNKIERLLLNKSLFYLSNIRKRNNCRVLFVVDNLPRQLYAQHVVKIKKMSQKSKQARKLINLKHTTKVMGHSKGLAVLSILPKHRNIIVRVMQYFFCLVLRLLLLSAVHSGK